MRSLTGRAVSRPLAALAGAAITLLAITASAPAIAQTTPADPSWDGSHWSSPSNHGETVSDGVFSGTFMHQPAEPEISHIELHFSFASAHDPACEPVPAPAPQTAPDSTTPTTPGATPPTDPTPTTAATNSRMDFVFEVGFPCNGVYDAIAVASLESPDFFDSGTHELPLTDLQIAVPPQRPVTFLATDNGNRTVTLTWTPPDDAPPDLVGFRLSRMDNGGSTFDVIGTTPPATFTFTDANIPAAGGSYFYSIETLRKAPIPTSPPLASTPVSTSDALVVGAGGSVTGSSVGSPGGGQVTGAGTGGTLADTEDTLAADEGEPGEGDLALPGAGAIQRFAGREGAGLIKPFAAALDLAVWAALVLFLTRRAAAQARDDVLAVELEDSY